MNEQKWLLRVVGTVILILGKVLWRLLMAAVALVFHTAHAFVGLALVAVTLYFLLWLGSMV